MYLILVSGGCIIEKLLYKIMFINPRRAHARSEGYCSCLVCVCVCVFRSFLPPRASTKRRAYEQRVREIEHGSFTPLVFSATGGMAPAATTAYKKLASLLADKRKQEYSKTICWLRCAISFSLVRSAVMCLWGARSSLIQNSRLRGPTGHGHLRGRIPSY